MKVHSKNGVTQSIKHPAVYKFFIPEVPHIKDWGWVNCIELVDSICLLHDSIGLPENSKFRFRSSRELPSKFGILNGQQEKIPMVTYLLYGTNKDAVFVENRTLGIKDFIALEYETYPTTEWTLYIPSRWAKDIIAAAECGIIEVTSADNHGGSYQAACGKMFNGEEIRMWRTSSLPNAHWNHVARPIG